jgi:hypothetical protein
MKEYRYSIAFYTSFKTLSGVLPKENAGSSEKQKNNGYPSGPSDAAQTIPSGPCPPDDFSRLTTRESLAYGIEEPEKDESSQYAC